MVPTYRDGTVLLSAFTPGDVASHLAGEDAETARRFGWWPKSSTEETVLRSFDDWAKSWANGGPIHTFAVRRQDTGELLGGCQLRKHDDGTLMIRFGWTAQPSGQHDLAVPAGQHDGEPGPVAGP